jgi:hypothetical protein
MSTTNRLVVFESCEKLLPTPPAREVLSYGRAAMLRYAEGICLCYYRSSGLKGLPMLLGEKVGIVS